jgi:cytochrome b6-f complex subunit 5
MSFCAQVYFTWAHVWLNNQIIYILPRYHIMVETLLSGIVLGLMPVTLSGLFVTAYLQYRRGDQLNL